MRKSVALKGMQFFGYHGYYEAERQTGNRYEVDVEIHYRNSAEPSNELAEVINSPINHISQVINYEDIASATSQVMATPTALLETLAQQILEKLAFRFEGFAPEIVVKVRKFNPPLGVLCAYSEVSLSNY